ncbi:MAG: haloacid dehalogenase-like hydrolase, partial [Candidatus Tectomicrobia bacterium]|nr:haloacid dehalogenase-like hydrolase [Candidatus Tectomicrobia bacterium]
AFLRAEQARGRRLILATAAPRRIADAVARHLGLFDAVIASDRTRHQAGAVKLTAIREVVRGGAFDYMGDKEADLPLFQAARLAILVKTRRPRSALIAAVVNAVAPWRGVLSASQRPRFVQGRTAPQPAGHRMAPGQHHDHGAQTCRLPLTRDHQQARRASASMQQRGSGPPRSKRASRTRC